MNEKLAKKLKKILTKVGLEEDKIDEIVDEVEGALAEEEVPEDNNPVDSTNPDQPSEDSGANEEGEPNPGEVPPTDEVPPSEEAPAVENPNNDGSIEQALNELAAQEQAAAPQEGEPAPAPAPAPEAAPTIDPDVQALADDLKEAHKTIDGLLARIDSLESALKEAGVISGDSKVGDETPRITPNANQNNEDAFEDVLATINGK